MNILTYKNHMNEVVEFGVNGLWFVDTELHDYEWKYTSNNGKISNFDRGIIEKKLVIVIGYKTPEQGIAYANQIAECTEKDILANTKGQLFWNDYYLKCFLISSQKANYRQRQGYIEIELTVLSDEPAWIKETSKSFDTHNGAGGKNLDYPFDFPYDFASPNKVKSLINPSFADTDFKLIIYGEVTNPSLYINGHLYSVNVYVGAGQYLTIDSRNKTVYLTQNNGEQVNHFKDRDKDNYVFQKIPSGENPVSWDGGFGFDITLYEERSEPKWI